MNNVIRQLMERKSMRAYEKQEIPHEDVQAILTEELSAYLEGSKSAADCAAMIQNRVSLYLAENS